MKILVLDNDRSMRELFALALRMQGLESVTVGTVEEAEAALPDVAALLLDFHLGGGHSGAVVARRWAAEGRLPPFWLVTGTPEDPEVRGLSDLPPLRAVIGKPFSLLAFAREVKRSLEPPPAPEAPAPSPAAPRDTPPVPCAEAAIEPENLE